MGAIRTAWFFDFGSSPSYRNRTRGPFETFAEARDAARDARLMGWSTSRPYQKQIEE